MIDLTEFREITQGDPIIESELFDDFCSHGDSLLKEINIAVTENNITAWKSNVHTLKGAALNLGATGLAEICKTAQEETDYKSFSTLANAIAHEFLQVKKFLENEKQNLKI